MRRQGDWMKRGRETLFLVRLLPCQAQGLFKLIPYSCQLKDRHKSRFCTPHCKDNGCWNCLSLCFTFEEKRKCFVSIWHKNSMNFTMWPISCLKASYNPSMSLILPFMILYFCMFFFFSHRLHSDWSFLSPKPSLPQIHPPFTSSQKRTDLPVISTKQTLHNKLQ